MRTEKEVTSISYNSIEFLDAKCNELVQSGIIDFFAFIKHKGELDPFDGARDKDHIHVLLRPVKALETSTLSKFFLELDKSNPTTPLGCVRFDKTNNPGTWVLYSLHYSPYLDSIGETKEFLDYPFHEFHTNNEQELRRYRKSVRIDYKPTFNTVTTLIKQGMSRTEIMQRTNATATQYKSINEMVVSELRGDPRFTIIDNETGKQI